MDLIDDLKARGMMTQITDEAGLRKHLSEGPTTVYLGMDPSADSLHCGSLVPLIALKRFHDAGHRVLPLIGGATGRIGDPTGKTETRNMLTEERIENNIRGVVKQIEHVLGIDTSDAENALRVVNNFDWFGTWGYIDFLREIGRHFTVDRMINAKTYADRLEQQTGLNFIEFNYMILQATDFLHLYKNENCHVQVGGNDQWGNMCAGVDLIRRVEGKTDAFALTFPLVLTASGRKMGKTENGAIWLDAKKTSPHDFFQYFRNTADADVEQFLKYFTFLDVSHIEELCAESGQALNKAKEVLAFEVTKLIHGEKEAKHCLDAAQGNAAALPTVTVDRAVIEAGLGVLNAFSQVAKLVASNGDVRRAIKGGGVSINDKKVTDAKAQVTLNDFDEQGYCLLKFGKKKKMRLQLQ